MNVELTKNEINYLTTLLRDTARAKQRRAKQVDPNDRGDMETAAMRDFDLRKKLIAAKVADDHEDLSPDWTI